MKLALYSSQARSPVPNLVALQDELFSALPTVLVCPLKAGMQLTALRVEMLVDDSSLVACPELARPIRRTALRPMGWLDARTSREIMDRFLAILAK